MNGRTKRTEERTDRGMTQQMAAFRNFANAPEKQKLKIISLVNTKLLSEQINVIYIHSNEIHNVAVLIVY